jgi:tetratricopeptide (TPR) repeat protein
MSHLLIRLGMCFGFFLGCHLLAPSSGLSQIADVGTVQEAMRVGDYEKAIELAKQQVEKKTWNEAWPRLLATNLMTLGRHPEALDVYKVAQERFSDSLRLKLLGHRILLENNLPLEAQSILDDLTVQIQRSPWRYSTKSELVPLGEFFLLQGEEPKQVLKLCYDQALKSDPKNVEAIKAIARMAVDKSDTKVASEAIERGMKITEGDPELFALAAEVWSSADRGKSREYLNKALEINPNLISALLMQAESFMDAEGYAQAIEVLAKVESINPGHPQLWALRAAIAHLQGAYSDEGNFRSRAFGLRKLNPVVDHKIGKHLSLHYRFAEGAQYQQRALAMDSKFHPARTQLAQDLLRLGREEEGWEMVELARKADPYHVTCYNLQILKEELAKYSTIEVPGFVIRMDAVESRVFGPEVVKILQEARELLGTKYKVQLNEPIVVELFSRQRDFAVRTFGLPGGEGFLGVCFGNVITANSPTALSVDHNWKSVLWHEYCHVITLNLTSNRMPRWLSEGISVYEERRHRPNWGEPANPIYIQWLRNGEFEPPSRMSRMFLAPKSPLHLQYAYFVASIVVEFWVEQFGHEGLLKLLADLRDGLPIADALARQSGSIDGIDQAFEAFAKSKGASIAPQLDFELIPKEESWSTWLESHPKSYHALHRKLDQSISKKDSVEALAIAQTLYDAWPSDPTESSALVKQSLIHRERKDIQAERLALQQWIELDPHASAPRKRLIEIERELQTWDSVMTACNSLLEIQPMQTSTLEHLAEACEKLGQPQVAISSLQALTHLDPLDPAQLHYRLAVAYHKAGQQSDKARRHCLMALEESPRYAQALELLLRLQSADPNR